MKFRCIFSIANLPEADGTQEAADGMADPAVSAAAAAPGGAVGHTADVVVGSSHLRKFNVHVFVSKDRRFANGLLQSDHITLVYSIRQSCPEATETTDGTGLGSRSAGS